MSRCDGTPVNIICLMIEEDRQNLYPIQDTDFVAASRKTNQGQRCLSVPYKFKNENKDPDLLESCIYVLPTANIHFLSTYKISHIYYTVGTIKYILLMSVYTDIRLIYQTSQTVVSLQLTFLIKVTSIVGMSTIIVDGFMWIQLLTF